MRLCIIQNDTHKVRSKFFGDADIYSSLPETPLITTETSMIRSRILHRKKQSEVYRSKSLPLDYSKEYNHRQNINEYTFAFARRTLKKGVIPMMLLV
jgi:hypothetical protein